MALPRNEVETVNATLTLDQPRTGDVAVIHVDGNRFDYNVTSTEGFDGLTVHANLAHVGDTDETERASLQGTRWKVQGYEKNPHTVSFRKGIHRSPLNPAAL